VSEEVTLQEIIEQNRLLRAENERQSLEIKLLKEKVDLLIRRLFGSKSEKLDAAQLELLLKEDASGKADASAEKAEASPSVEGLKPVAKRTDKNQRRERWPKDLAVEQEVIEPAEVRENPEAFRCIGEEVTEMLDYQPARFFRRQIIRRKFVRREQSDLAPVIAPLPESLQQRCIAAPGLLAQVIVSILRSFATLPPGTDLLESASGLVAASKHGPMGPTSKRVVKAHLPADQRPDDERLLPPGR
jgi:transposase